MDDRKLINRINADLGAWKMKMNTTAMANFILNIAAQLQKSHDFNSAILRRFN